MITLRSSLSQIEAMDPSKVYSGGCLRELVRLTPALQTQDSNPSNDIQEEVASGGLLNANVLYLGDSLFADLVDAKREYGWLTAAILRELKVNMRRRTYVIRKEQRTGPRS